MTANASVQSVVARDDALLLKEDGQNTNVLFADGRVELLTREQLQQRGIVQPSQLEVLKVDFEPIHRGKNILHVDVRNTSEQDQVFAIHIYTRSPDLGRHGVGWGRPFFDTIPAKETKSTRFAYKIQGAVTDATWVRLQFYNPAAIEQYSSDSWFQRVKHFGKELERLEDSVASLQPATADESEAAAVVLRQIQSHMKARQYELAWQRFTAEYRDAEQVSSLEDFEERMEPRSGHNMFFWDKEQFLVLEPQSVFRDGDRLRLTAACRDQSWTITFVEQNGQWRIDWIEGYPLRVLQWDNWKERLLPKMQKRSTKHFDIYYLKDSTAEKEIDLIASQKDKGFEQVCAFLGADSDVRICLVLFEDGHTKLLETGHEGDGWATGDTIVEVYNEQTKLDPYHETTHVLMRPFGDPPAAFSEGFAVYVSERLGAPALKDLGGGQATVYQRVRELQKQGKWVELAELLSYTNIGSQGDMTPAAYAEAGAFVKFLIDVHGKDKFLQAYRTLHNSDVPSAQKENISKLGELYGASLEELKEQWHQHLSKSPAG